MPSLTTEQTAMQEAVEALYALVDRTHLPSDLRVCFCPCCVDDNEYDALLTTPVRALSPDLIRAYSNSAHDTPPAADLRPLLPRYLELMSVGEDVDYTLVGTELLRFGDAWRQQPDLWSVGETAQIEAWAVAYLRAEARHGDDGCALAKAIPLLIAGGLRPSLVAQTCQSEFEAPARGQRPIVDFAVTLAWRDLRPGRTSLLEWFAIGYVTEAEKQALADWLNSPALATCVAEATQTEGLTEEELFGLDTLFGAIGSFAPASFPDHR
ncbi:MAG: hypothetical protein AAGB05_08225 [Pseudomonadota bacterium]